MVSSYFDINSYEDKSTVKYFLEDSFISLRPTDCVVQTIFLKKNLLKLEDNIFGLFYHTIESFFFQVSRKESFLSDQDEGPGPGIYFYQLFKIDSEYDIYERSVYTVTGVMKDVGGTYNALYFIGLLLYSQFQGSMFFASIISKVYQVDSFERERNLKEEYRDPHIELLSQTNQGKNGHDKDHHKTVKSPHDSDKNDLHKFREKLSLTDEPSNLPTSLLKNLSKYLYTTR